MKYDYAAIEKKWQDIWDSKNVFAASTNYTKPKYYALVEFPYPSGQGLHVGHPRSYTALDIISRKRRLQGYNVLYPMGWDAFGLPTENFAIKHHIHPEVVTKQNVARFKSQLKSLGLSFDWNREINTTDPNYYKWTQWIFLQLYKRGLAYKKAMSFMGENRQQLRYAQRAWIDFRDKECYARAKPYEEGTIFGIIVGRCEIDMTRHRTRELLKYYRP